MLYLRPNINPFFTEIIHNGPVHMYRRILRIKKITTSNSSSRNYVVNSVIVVSFVVIVPASNVISVEYDDKNDVLEVRA